MVDVYPHQESVAADANGLNATSTVSSLVLNMNIEGGNMVKEIAQLLGGERLDAEFLSHVVSDPKFLPHVYASYDPFRHRKNHPQNHEHESYDSTTKTTHAGTATADRAGSGSSGSSGASASSVARHSREFADACRISHTSALPLSRRRIPSPQKDQFFSKIWDRNHLLPSHLAGSLWRASGTDIHSQRPPLFLSLAATRTPQRPHSKRNFYSSHHRKRPPPLPRSLFPRRLPQFSACRNSIPCSTRSSMRRCTPFVLAGLRRARRPQNCTPTPPRWDTASSTCWFAPERRYRSYTGPHSTTPCCNAPASSRYRRRNSTDLRSRKNRSPTYPGGPTGDSGTRSRRASGARRLVRHWGRQRSCDRTPTCLKRKAPISG